MGNLDIASIKKNETLKQLMLNVDKKYSDDTKFSGNGNEKIDTVFEESALRGKIRTALVDGSLIEDDEVKAVANALGLDIDKENKKGITVTRPTKASRNVFEANVKELVKKTNSPDELMNALRARYIGQNGVPAEARELLADATEIYAAVKATNYKTKEDVDKIHDTVKKQLKDKKKYSGLNKDILKAFEELAEKEVKNKEFKALVNRFEAVKSTMSATDIVKEKGDHYKAYLHIVKDELKKDGTWKKSYTKEAYDMLEDYAKKKSENTHDAAYDAQALGMTVPKTDISFGKTNNNKRHEELAELKIAVDKRIEGMKTLTRQEIQKALGAELTSKLAVYINDHTDSATGKIDLSGLITDAKEGVRHHVGADNTMNRNYDDPLLDERHWTRYGLEELTGATLTDKEAQKIADFAGIPMQKKSHNVWKATKKNLPMLATGAAVGATFGVYADQSVTINVAAEMADKIVNQLGSAATKTLSADGLTANIDIRQVADLRALCALGGAFEALGIGILKDVIFGMKENEKSCFAQLKASQYHTLPELEHFVKKEFPDKAQAVMTMATLPRFMNEDGSWNSQKFYDFINGDVAGQGSVINHDECTMAGTVIPPETNKVEKVDGEKFMEEKVNQNDTRFDGVVPSIPNARHYRWENVTKIYECLDGMPQAQATRIMEVIQAIDPMKLDIPGQYNIDRITDIVAKAFKSNFKPNYEYINNRLESEYPEVSKDTLKAVLNATYLGTADKENKLVTPQEMFDTSGNVVCTRDLTKLRRPKTYGKGIGRSNVGVKTGFSGGAYTETREAHYYIRENGNVREVGKAEYDASPYKVGKRSN